MNILIIEDSKTLSQILYKLLKDKGINTEILTSKEYDKRYIQKDLYDIVTVNVNLKDYGSLSILDEVREQDRKVLVIGIANNNDWRKKVTFLNAGADDVITFPFPKEEFLSRISSLLRRPKTFKGEQLKLYDYTIHADQKKVTKNKKKIPLRKKEFQVLEYMVRNKGKVVSRNELFDHVWDYRRMSSSNTVDVHMKRIREKLKDNKIIETIHGFGYTIPKRRTKTTS